MRIVHVYMCIFVDVEYIAPTTTISKSVYNAFSYQTK
jgi:hypothetical protein